MLDGPCQCYVIIYIILLDYYGCINRPHFNVVDG